MWTAQTYLGASVGKAQYFMYLLVEDYISEQEAFGKSVVRNLQQLGMRTGEKSAIFVPDDSARDHIRMELFDLFRKHLMEKIFQKTPGILFTDKSLSELDPEKDRWVFLSLTPFIANTSTQSLGEFFKEMERAITGADDLLDAITGPKWRSFWAEAKNRFMFEPNFYGIGYRGREGRSRVVISANIN